MNKDKKLITYEELVKHTSRSDCWLSVEGKVLNVTKFLAEHPGGEDILIANSGTDATKYFQGISGGKGHTDYARSFFEMYYIGDLDKTSTFVEPIREHKTPKRLITYAELANHSTEEDCWVLLNGVVYDITPFLSEHPGGPNVVTNLAGDDITEAFNDQGHSENAKEIAKKYEVGLIDTGSQRVSMKKRTNGGMTVKDWIVLLIGVAVAIAIAVYFNTPDEKTTEIVEAVSSTIDSTINSTINSTVNNTI
jgi:cytochrome b involved in lipid metabolism